MNKRPADNYFWFIGIPFADCSPDDASARSGELSIGNWNGVDRVLSIVHHSCDPASPGWTGGASYSSSPSVAEGTLEKGRK